MVLQEPLKTVLSKLAIALHTNRSTAEIGHKGLYFNYYELLSLRNTRFSEYLRDEVERLSRRTRTVRHAGIGLIPRMRSALPPLFWLVVCDYDREERFVEVLQRGDSFYVVAAPDERAETITVIRLDSC